MKRIAPVVLLLALAGCADGPGGAQQSPAPQERAVVWAVGDGAAGTEPAQRLAKYIDSKEPDRFLYLGDVYDHGTAEEFRRNYEPIYGRLADVTSPTPGNHEWANRRTGYYPYWRRKQGRRMRPWYRLRLGGWEILSLNSEARHDRDSAQLRWLRRRLAERDGTCRLAFMHRPRYSAGTAHGDAPDMAPIWRALRGHARLVLSGHEHDLQRFRKIDGLTQLINGAGGAVSHSLRSDSRLRFGLSDRLAALRIVLKPGRALIEFRTRTGRLLDRSRARCKVP